MMGRIDRAIGKWLFVPLVIRVCQMLGCSQYRFSAYGWMLVVLAMLAKGPALLGTWGFVLFSVVAASRVAFAALAPERIETSLGFVRALFIFATVSGLIEAACGKPDWLNLAINLGALTAEYALTIKTIPPRDTKEAGRLTPHLETNHLPR